MDPREDASPRRRLAAVHAAVIRRSSPRPRAATIATAAIAIPTSAEARRGGGWHGGGWHGGGWRGGWGHRGFGFAPVVGGLAAGALIGGALASPYYYGGYGYPYGAYAYGAGYGGGCVLRRERFWNGWTLVVRGVRVCY